MIIAIDGPAASGKGTLAKRLAEELGYAYLDTGLLYRAVAQSLIKQGHELEDIEAALAAAQSLAPDDLDDEDLRSEEVGQAASKVAAIPEIREALLVYQRGFAQSPPGGLPGAVIDGRDIGTVVCPGAAHKLFVTADLEVRVERRFLELGAAGATIDRDRVRREMAERDARDRERGTAPLAAAPDAIVLDTSELDADGAFEAALAAISGSPGTL